MRFFVWRKTIYPIPLNESARLSALQHYNVLDTPGEAVFDDIVRLARDICGSQVSLISLIDSDRQWFKAQIGLGELTETPREQSFCAHAIMSDELFVVEDASQDVRFRRNPLVIGSPNIRFYAAVPLTVAKDIRLGTLCVFGDTSGGVSADQLRALFTLRDAAVAQLKLAYLESKLPLNVCAWCNQMLDDTRNGYFPNTSLITHGICSECTSSVRSGLE